MSERLDRFGAVASTLCALHCALCAFLPIVFTAAGLSFLIGHEAEWVLTIVAIAFASGALFWGWVKHRSIYVVGLLSLGIVGLLASRGLEMGSGHHDHHGGHHAEEGKEDASHAAHQHEKHEAHEKHAKAGHDHHDEHGNKEEKHHGHEKHEAHEKHAKAEHDHHDEHGDEGEDHHAHGGSAHLAGTAVGVLGGLLLLIGHLLNIRTIRRVKAD